MKELIFLKHIANQNTKQLISVHFELFFRLADSGSKFLLFALSSSANQFR